MYHGVVSRIQDPELDRWAITQAEFARHIAFLSQFYEVVSLGQAVDAVQSGYSLPNAVVLVFDDAFANVLQNARPLMRERRIPYSVAVPVGLIGTKRTIWSLEAKLMLLRAPVSEIRLPLQAGTQRFILTTRSRRLAAAKIFLDDLSSSSDAARRSRLEAFFEQLPPGARDHLLNEFGEFKLMRSDDIRQIHAEGASILAHGLFHIPLDDSESPDLIEGEIFGSKKALESMIQAPLQYFVYPYGVTCAAAERLVRAAGYRAAFTTRHGALRAGQDLFQLPRIAAECSLSHLKYQFATLSA
jgi:peptidoglycan/xylan/chitin deacetylase (PgdA/CDA1 family)